MKSDHRAYSLAMLSLRYCARSPTNEYCSPFLSHPRVSVTGPALRRPHGHKLEAQTSILSAFYAQPGVLSHSSHLPLIAPQRSIERNGRVSGVRVVTL